MTGKIPIPEENVNVEDRLRGIDVEDRLRGLSHEELKKLQKLLNEKIKEDER